uniref:Uncharacterized protein n=1 Tax=Knipowitschia caucasica TaxID=637954 RepID=A0AAV2L7Q5_KNICA
MKTEQRILNIRAQWHQQQETSVSFTFFTCSLRQRGSKGWAGDVTSESESIWTETCLRRRVNVTMASEREQIPGTISEEAAGGSTEPGVCVRTKSSVSSAVSLKSDWSMPEPPDFSLEAASSKPQ